MQAFTIDIDKLTSVHAQNDVQRYILSTIYTYPAITLVELSQLPECPHHLGEIGGEFVKIPLPILNVREDEATKFLYLRTACILTRFPEKTYKFYSEQIGGSNSQFIQIARRLYYFNLIPKQAIDSKRTLVYKINRSSIAFNPESTAVENLPTLEYIQGAMSRPIPVTKKFIEPEKSNTPQPEDDLSHIRILDGIEEGLRAALQNKIFIPDNVTESAKLFDIYTKLRKHEDDRIRAQSESSVFEPYKNIEERELNAMILECIETLQYLSESDNEITDDMLEALKQIID